jgi:hypothetical protein
MALLDAINAARPAVSKSMCGVRRVLSELSGADAADLRSALSNPVIESSAIAKGVAVALGARLAASSVARHRKGECSCQ